MVIEHGKSSYIEFYADIVEGGVRVRSEVQMGDYAIGEGWLLENITVLGLSLLLVLMMPIHT